MKAIPCAVVVLALAATALSCPRGFAASRPAWVIPEVLNVRTGPGTGRARTTTLPRGAKVYVVLTQDNWCKISYDGGKRGWVAEWLLEFSAEKGRKLAAEAKADKARPSSSPAWITKPRVNVRAGPTTRGKRIACVEKDTRVRVTSRSGNWAHVTLDSGRTGWIRSDLLTSKAPRGAQAATQAAAHPRPPKGYISDDDVNVRSGPGSRFSRDAVLDKGAVVWVLETKDHWCKVKYGDGRGGWVASWLIKMEDDGSSAPSEQILAALPKDGEEAEEAIAGLFGWIANDDVNARYGPGMEFDVKSAVERDAKVAVVDIDGHWCKIKLPVGETYGWVPGWTLNFSGPGGAVLANAGEEKTPVHVGWIAREDVNLRGDPGRDAPVVTRLTANTQIVILDKRSDWYKVALSTNQIGWVSSSLVTTREQRLAAGDASAPGAPSVPIVTASADSPAPANVGGLLVQTAMSYLNRGIRYRYGGSSVRGGFDCSGFIQAVLRQRGREVPRRASHQYLCGKPVSKSQLLPGDLVFFKNTYKRGISHVGMYVGAGRFIHSSSAARGITISSLSKSYYSRKYAGARRVY